MAISAVYQSASRSAAPAALIKSNFSILTVAKDSSKVKANLTQLTD